uniref:Nuclear receptor-binding protein homolog n=1 Tax=Phallusia mammillata TaxID=59560 RepID=A0A6F9DN28_9ASCI|nr:nuclear receptor-binding protein-like [Phallusia mammillata]
MSEKEASAKAEDSEHESEEDESEILEESPCGRWLKRNEEVSQRNVPGIDCAFLAMDSEEGVEVVWNEVLFSERKSYNAQEEKIRAVFDNLTRIDHANIVKFHRYWIDWSKNDPQKTRVIFITEYMSSGSVKKFLNKTKDVHKYKSSKSWKRWCRQILSALSYLHSCDPAIVHGNLTCDTIFIQHNGLLKIGSVAPDAIRNHVKTYLEIHKNFHYFAPECTDTETGNITPAVDIYSFGICALEMALPKVQLVGENKKITPADIDRAVNMLDDTQQRNFLRLCISKDPAERPSARDLLLHPVLFEVHSLKLLSAHAFVKHQDIFPENQMDFYEQKERKKSNILASVAGKLDVTEGEQPAFDVDKYLEDVRNGIYPLTAFALPKPARTQVHPQSPSEGEDQLNKGLPGSTPQQPLDVPETRRIIQAQCCFIPREDESEGSHVIIHIRFEDKQNRQLRCDTSPTDTAQILAQELANLNFIREDDKDYIADLLENEQAVHQRVNSILESADFQVQLESISEVDQSLQNHQLNNNNSYGVFDLASPPYFSQGQFNPAGEILSPSFTQLTADVTPRAPNEVNEALVLNHVDQQSSG